MSIVRGPAAVVLVALLAACGNADDGATRGAPAAEGATTTSAATGESTVSPSAPPSASDLGSGTLLSPDPEAVAAWDSALGRFSSLATLEYTIDSALLGPDGSGVRTVRTTSVDHDRGIARVHALISANDGSAVPQEFEINSVMTPDSVLLQMPGWVTTMPEMEGKWLELTPDRMDEAGLPPGVGVLDIGDHFPPLELLEFAPVSMEQTNGSLVLAGSLSAPEALSLLGAGSYLTQNPEAALSMRGTVAAVARVDDAGFLRSLTLRTGEHTIDVGDDPMLAELVSALPHSSAELTILAFDEPVEITVPPVEDRVSDFPSA